MSEGWVKLHRKLKDNPIYTNSVAVHCWIECLLRVNHDQKTFFLGNQKITLEAGQFVTGRIEFGKSINKSPTTAWFWLKQFQLDSMIDIKSTNKYSVITILKWKDYQQLDINIDSKKTAKRQQKDTNKNDKNEKNIICDKNEIDFIAQKLLEHFNKTMNKKVKSYLPFKNNLIYWLGIYSKEEIAAAISRMPNHNFFKLLETPVTLFRKKNQNKEDVDYIGQLLNMAPIKKEGGAINNLINE